MTKNILNKYESVIGIEVHVELSTKTKIFCSCPVGFGARPNTNVCPICMGHPGTLPYLNREAVNFAIRAGLATNCEISETSAFDRKNYFYPDLPKGYQISQADLPLCKNGHIVLKGESGEEKRVRINRIHIEEDAGKLIHNGELSFIDYNRAGTPLIEIVSEPDISSGDEAKAYLKKLRELMVYVGISECRMNEGSFRCDVNISVKRKEDTEFGVRTEIKNINSFAFVGKAIAYEFERQVALIESGEAISPQTRRFDERSGKTELMRVKESSEDYRYFPEPNLMRVSISQKEIDDIRSSLPTLPDERREKYINELSIPFEDSDILSRERSLSEYFEAALEYTKYPRVLSNLIISEMLRLSDGESFSTIISPENLGTLCDLFGNRVINSNTAKILLSEMWESNLAPAEAVTKRGLAQISDKKILADYIEKAIAASPKLLSDYLSGKRAARGAIFGRSMALSEGKADPKLLGELLDAILEEKENK